MSGVRPSMVELAEAVREHLDREVLSRLEGKAAYELRVASNLLAILQREAELGPTAAAREQTRVAQLIGEEEKLEHMNAVLSDRIREREFDAGHPKLLEHLRQTVLDRLSIDNPKYSAYRRATRL